LAPKGLYARALIIIIAPIVLLESVVAFTFMERHWNQVTRRLSDGMARDIGAIVDLYEVSASKDDVARLVDLAQNRFGLSMAALPFLEMRGRIRHHVEQRTTMLAGVSHDLRTVLTRFKLELALLPDNPESQALRNDVNEMQHMLEDYLAFAKGDGGEEAAPTNVGELLDEVQEEPEHLGTPIEVRMRQPKHELVLPLKRQAFKRAVTNLVTNAARFGNIVIIRAGADETWLRIEV